MNTFHARKHSTLYNRELTQYFMALFDFFELLQVSVSVFRAKTSWAKQTLNPLLFLSFN